MSDGVITVIACAIGLAMWMVAVQFGWSPTRAWEAMRHGIWVLTTPRAERLRFRAEALRREIDQIEGELRRLDESHPLPDPDSRR